MTKQDFEHFKEDCPWFFVDCICWGTGTSCQWVNCPVLYWLNVKEELSATS